MNLGGAHDCFDGTPDVFLVGAKKGHPQVPFSYPVGRLHGNIRSILTMRGL